LAVDELVCNPADRQEVVRTIEGHGFVVRECETFTPEVHFADLNEFLEFAYYGGLLKPLVPAFCPPKAKPLGSAPLNLFFFPVKDHHSIEIVLAQKAEKPSHRPP